MLLATYELWLYSKRPTHAEHLWMAVMCLMAAGYAGLMGAHYNVGADAAVVLSRFEGATIAGACFASLAWALTVADRASPRALAWLGVAATVVVASTLSPWAITSVHAVAPPFGGDVFWRRDPTPLVNVLQFIAVVLVVAALALTTRAPPERRSSLRYFQVGMGLWVLCASPNMIGALVGSPAPLSTIEYGFAALALSLVAHDVRRFMEALSLSEDKVEATELQHRALESLHRDVVSSIGEGVVMLDPEERVRLWNPVAAKLLDVSVERALGEKLWDVLSIAEHDRATLTAKLREASDGNVVTTAPFTQRAGGREVQVVWTLAPFDSQDAGRGAIAVLRDVTSEQSARAALIRSEKNSRALIDALPDAIAVMDDDRILYVNAALSDLLGLESEDSLSGLRAGRLVHYADRSRLQALRQTGSPAELRMAARGRSVVAEIRCVPIEFDGAPAEALVARDVTERNELTARMMELDRMVAVGTLAAGVGHEINNPLAFLTANLEELEQTLSPVASEAKVLVEEALVGSRRIRDIVRSISGFSRAGGERRTISLSAAVHSATTLAGNELRHRARLSVEHQQEFYVEANEADLGQVLLNLLVNASHAVRDGGPEQNSVRVRTYSDQGRAVCEVSDTGCGISPSVLPRIFDPFFTTKPVGEGTGLGLSICLQTVRSLGGNIEVESEAGVGTTFRVLLPAVEPATEPLRLANRSPAASGRRARLMLVDDDENLLRSLSRPLRRHFDLTLCVSAEDALSHLERGEEFEAILTDLMMPGTSGMELYEWVLQLDPGVAARMLFTTGGAFTPAATRFCAAMEDRVLPKPISVAELRDRVEALAGPAAGVAEIRRSRLH